jgi:LEA14-like dessication related protein
MVCHFPTQGDTKEIAMVRFTKLVVCLTLFITSVGCASLEPGFETPTVGITSLVPKFEIGLHIVNPNRSSLKLDGLVYSVTLEGHKVLTGVSNNLPTIDAYGEGDIVLIATADLLNSIGLFASLLQSQQEAFDYKLDAKLDIGSFRPRIHVVKEGEISLQGVARQ